MSRTLKERPGWVKVNDPRMPTIVDHCHTILGKEFVSAFTGEHFAYADTCTEDEPAKSRAGRRPGELRMPCTKDLAVLHRTRTPPGQDVRDQFWAPDRASERSILRRLADEYNTTGDLDEGYVLPGQHRHARFGRGYWD